MPLFLPPAVSINKFTGEYKAVSDYTDLGDTDTNDAQNTLYGPNGDIDKRPGSKKLLRTKPGATGLTTPSDSPITGHYYFSKLGPGTDTSVVCFGTQIYSYSSSTSNSLLTGISGGSEAYFSFCQIQDPRSAGDDILLIANTANTVKVWNGSASALNLSSFTSATQVPIAKFILSHKARIYAANILDTTAADTAVQVKVTEFGSDGLANPHRFTEGFFVGGSNRFGELTGQKILNDQIVYYTRGSVWKFSPGSGNTLDTSVLMEIDESIGCFAPRSLVDVGGAHCFFSERGVHLFNGSSFQHISEKVDSILFEDSNLTRLQLANAVYNKRDNQYVLYFAGQGSQRNDRGLVYDFRSKQWQPIVKGREPSTVSTYVNTDGIEKIIYGDYVGYLYEDSKGKNDGILVGNNGQADSVTINTLTDSDANFSTTEDGLAGLFVEITSGAGEGQIRQIQTNTSAVLTLYNNWTTLPNSNSTFSVAGVNANWRSKDYDFGNHDLVKLFRQVAIRAREEGNINLTLHYIVDFKELARATSKDVNLLESGMAWDSSVWDTDRWDGVLNIKKKVSLRSTANQGLNGTHLAVRFSNKRANEGFRITGFDIDLKATGKR